MQKLFLPLLFVFIFVTQGKAQQRLFDQAVQLKTCNISIEANSFIATTVIEMEFYNPKDQEVEGLHSFELNRGQVITDFQLELNGKYREGSIEERWKARQAYSSIVGKRIDPALLQMSWGNYYSINIYPIAAKSSRKIKFTITQLMAEENLKLSYTLPLNIKSVTENFNLNIKVSKPASIPYANTGLLENRFFNMNNDEAILSQQSTNIILNRPISFSISQFSNKPQLCINTANGKTNFLMRFFPDMPKYYSSKPAAINVYWDVSLSGKGRNLVKELDFLEKYISENQINKTNIFLFNQQMQGLIVFDRMKDNFSFIRNYLLSYKYSGATQLGILDFSNVLADAVLLFSDGINSIGHAQPKLGAVQVNLIISTYSYSQNQFQHIVGNTGGSIINLNYTEIKHAVKRIDSAENFLFKYASPNIRINETFPIKLGNSILLSGTINQSDNLELFYGNNTVTTRSENYFLPANLTCDETTFKKMQMLKAYDSLMYGYNSYYRWQDMVVFGLTERVVTPQTSYLVLERIEDYIKYKIAPPKELEEKCAELNYVYKSEYKIKALKAFTEQDALDPVVKAYNNRISWWNKDAELINLDKPVPDQKNIDVAATPPGDKNKTGPGFVPDMQQDFKSTGGDLKEVVVTGAFGTKRVGRSVSYSAQTITGDQLNTIRQVNINEALAGKVAGAQVRSQSYAKLGSETMLRLRGENGFGAGSGALYVLDGTIMSSMSDISPDNIEDVTVLQGPAAAALFGPDGANGAIVMNSKKAKRSYGGNHWTEYKLSSAPDEDYVIKLREAANYELWDVFLKLEKENKMDVGFYFETANFFFEKGKMDKAQELMYNAIELSNGSIQGLTLAAYMYEQWKWFDKAIAVYKGILSGTPNNLNVKRDLALAYFQNKNYEAAVKTYYSIVTAAVEDVYSSKIKDNALAEMNAILVLHKNEFDVSYINFNLVKILPVDLRITIGTNHSYSDQVKIVEPGNKVCSSTSPSTTNGGRFNGHDYNAGFNEYSIRDAVAGRYRVKINAYDYNSYYSSVPVFVRVVTFKNFHKNNMEMSVKIFDLDNQYGVIELDEIYW